MKKLYTILALSSLVFSANAQQGARRIAQKHHTAATPVTLNRQVNQNAAIVCDTVTTIGASDSLFLYTVTSAGGYLAGSNGYLDKQKATYIPASLVPAGGTITGVMAIMFRDPANNLGTMGTAAVSVDILAGDTTNGPTGSSLGNAASTLTAMTTGGTQAGTDLIYTFLFGTPVNAPAAGFFASMNVPTTAGDTVAMFISQTSNNTNPNYPNWAWEYVDLGSGYIWIDFRSDWNLPCALTMLPIICYNSTGVHNNVLEASMAMYPNPSNGQLNFAMNLPEATNLTVSVMNTLGQAVFTKTENNFKGGVLKYDLTSLGKGVYYANITDSNNNKVVKKVVIE